MADPILKAINSASRCQRHLTRFVQRGTAVLSEDIDALSEITDVENTIERAKSTHTCILDELQSMIKAVDDLEAVMDENKDHLTPDHHQKFAAFDDAVSEVKESVSQLDARLARLQDIKTRTMVSHDERLSARRQAESPSARSEFDSTQRNYVYSRNTIPLSSPCLDSPCPLPSSQFPDVKQPRCTSASVRGGSARTLEGGNNDADSANNHRRELANVSALSNRENIASTPLNQPTLADLADVLSRIPNSGNRSNQPDNGGFGYKIPKFTLPNFDGKAEEWKPFWDRFERAIHRNPTIADADKLSYLMSYMKGEAEMLVNGMPLTNENYHVAVRQLRDNFGDPKIAIEKVRQKQRDLPLVAASSYPKFKEFFFVFEQLAKRLEHLGGDVSNEHLVDIILDKLPRFITDKVERAKDDDDDWTMSRLRSLLAKELKTEGKIERRMERRSALIRSTESHSAERPDQRASHTHRRGTTDAFASSEEPRQFQNTPVRFQVPAYGGSAGAASDVRPKNPCIFCNGSHWMNECNQYPTARQRAYRIKPLRLCFICLQRDHQAKDCTSEKSCFHCRQTQRHHTSLCPIKFPDRHRKSEHAHVGDETTIRDLTRPEEYGALGDDEQTVMKTAQVIAVNPTNDLKQVRIRAYLDNGTSRTFLSERAAEALKLTMGPKKTLRIKR